MQSILVGFCLQRCQMLFVFGVSTQCFAVCIISVKQLLLGCKNYALLISFLLVVPSQ